jgi:hypothetical protein
LLRRAPLGKVDPEFGVQGNAVGWSLGVQKQNARAAATLKLQGVLQVSQGAAGAPF